MLQAKTLVVTGQTLTRNGKREKTLAADLDKALNAFLKEIPGEVKDIKTNIEFGGASGDSAVVVVLFEAENKKEKAK